MKKLKLQPKKLEPIQILPKFKKLQDENMFQTVNSEQGKTKSNVPFQSAKAQDLTYQKDGEKTLREDLEADGKSTMNQNHASVEFVSQNKKHIICEELLKNGYIESFHDFFSILIAEEEKLQEKHALIEKTLIDLKLQLMKSEEELSQGNYEAVLLIYGEIAEKYLEANVEVISRYFYSKIINLLNRFKTEKKIDQQLYFQKFISAKLGLVKCFNLDTESAIALMILEEIYNKTQDLEEYKSEIAAQLISLYQKLGNEEEKIKKFDKAIDYYWKCLLICVENSMQKEECLLILTIANIYKEKGDIQKAIQTVKEHNVKNIKLPKDFSVKFEISSFRLLAKCYEILEDFEEAENNYRNFYELLKGNDENRDLYAGEPSLKLGNIYWRKDNCKEALKYYLDYFEEGLKSKTKNREVINCARVTLSVAKGFDEFEDFMEYFQMSKNRTDDIIAFKKNRRIL